MHGIYRVTSLEMVAPFTLELQFDDGTNQKIDFEPVLSGELYGPLRDPNLFNQVRIDSEVHTIVWPNGADFEPATLRDWDELADELIKQARRREPVPA